MAFATALGAMGAPIGARADTGGAFGTLNEGWDGLSDLVGLGATIGVALETPSEVELDTLDPQRDALLLVHPTVPLPARGLTDFLRRGGRVAIADDFGRADAFLGGLHIERHVPATSEVPSLRLNPALPVAQRLYDHPLTAGVHGLVANHPAVVRHRDLVPLIAFDDSGDALLVAGAIGEGRLVVLGDPSTLINNMLELRGNRRFGLNLLEYLDGGRRGRVVLASGSTPIVGRRGDTPGARGLSRLGDLLSDLAHATLPPSAIRTLYVTLALLALVFTGATVPRKSPYRVERMLPQPRTYPANRAPRVWFARPRAHLGPAALAYAEELVLALTSRLALPADASTATILSALRARGLDSEGRARAEPLLGRLHTVRQRAQAGVPLPKIGRAELERMVDTGDELLAYLDGSQEKA